MAKIKITDLYYQDGPSEGYVNFPKILKLASVPFIFMIGARGIGKTFGAIDALYANKWQSIFLRRTQTQADEISVPTLSPVKPVCSWYGVDYKIESISKSLKGVTFGDMEEPLMYSGALSTLHNLRGFDASETTHFFYDEFIPQPNEKPIQHEGEAFLNAYETMNRNRELKGLPPMQFVGMSNSNRLDNPLFMDLNMVTFCDKLFSKGYCFAIDENRGFAVINFEDSPISKRKNETALYKFSRGTDFAAMALDNEFRDYRTPSKSYPLKALVPMANVGEITICRVKGVDKGFVIAHILKAPEKFNNDEKGLAYFYTSGFAKAFWLLYLEENMEFESYYAESLFKKYCNNSRKMI